jgi:hypothetical protein
MAAAASIFDTLLPNLRHDLNVRVASRVRAVTKGARARAHRPTLVRAAEETIAVGLLHQTAVRAICEEVESKILFTAVNACAHRQLARAA